MFKICKLFLVFGLVLLSTGLLSAEVKNTTIKSLWVNDSSSNVIFVEPSNSFLSVCSSSPGKYFILEPNLPNMKEAYSMLLAAMMSGRKVTIGGKGDCWNSNEKMRYVYLSE